MKLGLVVHPERGGARAVADDAAAAAVELGMSVEDVTPGAAGELDAAGADLLVAIGGDGTVLQAARLALEADVPILGVNMGHVGYLAAVEPQRLREALEVLAGGDWVESRRMTVTASWAGGTATGLNDVVVEKVVSQHAVRILLDIDDRHFTTYRCDGLVIATPTGSTAYAFSAGGPMLDPELAGLVITPVAPHNVFAPTLVLPAGSQLRATAAGDRPVRVNVDGREVVGLDPGEPVEVGEGSAAIRFVVPWPRPFNQVVREKFGLDSA